MIKGVSRLKAKLTRSHVGDRFPQNVRRPRPGFRPRTVVLLVTMNERLAHMQFHMFARYAADLEALGYVFISRPYEALVAGGDIPAADAVFVQSTYTPPEGELEGLMQRLAATNPQAKISYFDWFAPTDIRMCEKVVGHAHRYVKKTLLRDRSAYLTELIGHSNLSDFYEERYGTDNPRATWKVPPEIVPRLRAGPAFGSASDLIHYFEAPTLPPSGDRPVDLQARIEVNGQPWYQLMRRQAAAAADALTGLNIAAGRISKKLYMAEMAATKLCFSPFGYGEICWRDYEAIAMGAVLIKPDMSHIECSPDIYQANRTYVPVRWDFSDLEEQVTRLLADPGRQRAIAHEAFGVLHDYLRGDALPTFLQDLTA